VAVRIGTSGWSYPSWRGGFYPEGSKPEEFLRFYAERFDTVELNATGYRLPSEDQFAKWADAVPDGFVFSVKLPVTRLDRIGTFVERVRLLGDRLGPIRVVITTPRDDGMLLLLEGSIDPSLEVAWDLQHPTWDDVVAPGVRVNDDTAEPFRYLRLREPPYSDEDLTEVASRVRAPAYVYFRHEGEASAPAYASRLRELLQSADVDRP
jgi:uncharacterized protein YecE (DUF72 family)